MGVFWKMIAMAGGAVATGRKGLALRQADRIEVGIMAVGATLVDLRVRRIDERRCIAMTVAADGVADSDQIVVAFEKGMDGGESGTVAGEATNLAAVQAILDKLCDD